MAKNIIKAVLIDLSGTIHIENEAIPGAIEALKRLRNRPELKIKFVTNTTKESSQSLLTKLTGMGFDIKQEEIVTSLVAARELILQKSLKPSFLLVDDHAMDDFKGIWGADGNYDETPNAVLVALAPKKMNFHNMNTSLEYLMKGAELIAVHRGRYHMTSSGLSLGPGPFVTALEYAASVKATTVGKPSPDFYRLALPAEVIPDHAVMIGDDVESDIGGAQELGIRGFLVKTGKYLPGDENKISPPPHAVVDSISQAVDIILND